MMTRREIIEKYNIKKKSKLFVFPMLQIRLIHENRNLSYFIDLSLHNDYEFVLTFENSEYDLLRMDLQKIMNSVNYNGFLSKDDNEINLYMKVPDEFKRDYEKFLEGKYSKFTKRFKDVLTNVYYEGRFSGFEDNGLPKFSVYDVIYPNDDCINRLAKALSTDDSIISFDKNSNIELLDPPSREIEDFRTIEELNYIYNK